MNNETQKNIRIYFIHSATAKARRNVYTDSFQILPILIVRLSYLFIFISDVYKVFQFPNGEIYFLLLPEGASSLPRALFNSRALCPAF